MSARWYGFKVGQIECAVVLDGMMVIGRAGILKRYHDATEADYERAFADIGLSIEDAQSSLNVLVAKVGGEVVLVDTGEGGKPKGGNLLEGLRAAGIPPETVTRVVLTHSHGDHVLGLLSASGEPMFPNATYIMSKAEMAHWRACIERGDKDERPYAEMIEARGLRLIDMDEPILPGLTAVPTAGHTPGQIGLLFESDGEALIQLADTLHSPMQFAHPEWSPSFDIDTSQSVPTRRRMLERAADENLLVAFYHMPFPGLGRVRRAGQGFAWDAVE